MSPLLRPLRAAAWAAAIGLLAQLLFYDVGLGIWNYSRARALDAASTAGMLVLR